MTTSLTTVLVSWKSVDLLVPAGRLSKVDLRSADQGARHAFPVYMKLLLLHFPCPPSIVAEDAIQYDCCLTALIRIIPSGWFNYRVTRPKPRIWEDRISVFSIISVLNYSPVVWILNCIRSQAFWGRCTRVTGSSQLRPAREMKWSRSTSGGRRWETIFAYIKGLQMKVRGENGNRLVLFFEYEKQHCFCRQVWVHSYHHLVMFSKRYALCRYSKCTYCSAGDGHLEKSKCSIRSTELIIVGAAMIYQTTQVIKYNSKIVPRPARQRNFTLECALCLGKMEFVCCE
jgi:hypothetical protein